MADPKKFALEMMSLLIANLPAEKAFDKIARAMHRAEGDAGAVCQLLIDDAERFLPDRGEEGR